MIPSQLSHCMCHTQEPDNVFQPKNKKQANEKQDQPPKRRHIY